MTTNITDEELVPTAFEYGQCCRLRRIFAYTTPAWIWEVTVHAPADPMPDGKDPNKEIQFRSPSLEDAVAWAVMAEEKAVEMWRRQSECERAIHADLASLRAWAGK